MSPRLHLTTPHFMVFNLCAGLGGDVPPGVDSVGNSGGLPARKWVVSEPELLESALGDSLPPGAPDASPGDLAEAVRGLLLILNASCEMNWGASYDKHEDGSCYIYSEEYGAGDDVFAFLQWVLSGLPDVPWISYEYADWCDKTRPNEFGGGAWFFAQGKEPKYLHTATWLQTQISELVVDEIIEEIAAGGDE